jgi:hypothetical protein
MAGCVTSTGLKNSRCCLKGVDYVGVKTVEGDVTLQEFLAGMFAYRPGLIRFLYRVRC